jgi:RNA polymerase sigma-70 factor (ECF subfamily)
VEGLPNNEIAEMLELSVPAVKSRLHRARLRMRDALAPHFEGVNP